MRVRVCALQFMPTMQYVQDGQMYSVVMDPTTGQMFQVGRVCVCVCVCVCVEDGESYQCVRVRESECVCVRVVRAVCSG